MTFSKFMKTIIFLNVKERKKRHQINADVPSSIWTSQAGKLSQVFIVDCDVICHYIAR